MTKDCPGWSVVSTQEKTTGSLVVWAPELKTATLGLFEDLSSECDLRDSTSTSAGILCVLGSQTVVPITCKTQSAVSHRSTEPEIISLDAGLCLNRLPALQCTMLGVCLCEQ